MDRKIVQVVTTAKGSLFALCADGTLWLMRHAEDEVMATRWTQVWDVETQWDEEESA